MIENGVGDKMIRKQHDMYKFYLVFLCWSNRLKANMFYKFFLFFCGFNMFNRLTEENIPRESMELAYLPTFSGSFQG